MTGLILIDESGDLGSAGSRYFTISAVITSMSRNLRSVSKLIPDTMPEHKFYNADDEERISVVREFSQSDSVVVSAVIEKNCPQSGHCTYGNDLYRTMLRNLLELAMPHSRTRDVNIIVDGSRYIKDKDLRSMCETIASDNGFNLKKCYKGISQNEPCLKVVDFIASSIGAEYERGDKTYTDEFREKMSVARRY
ncbi:MAG: hypothetical protein PWR17_692 [Candidatus Methanomethylophilaceae archaeon]|nr:hypothetical protein [Candidatus Methanomethylophilaceae archaeon]